jgi:hypothetical protein
VVIYHSFGCAHALCLLICRVRVQGGVGSFLVSVCGPGYKGMGRCISLSLVVVQAAGGDNPVRPL